MQGVDNDLQKVYIFAVLRGSRAKRNPAHSSVQHRPRPPPFACPADKTEKDSKIYSSYYAVYRHNNRRYFAEMRRLQGDISDSGILTWGAARGMGRFLSVCE